MKQKKLENKKTCKITKPNRLKQITTSGILKNMILIRVKLTNNTKKEKKNIRKKIWYKKNIWKKIFKKLMSQMLFICCRHLSYISFFSLGNV